MIRLAFLLALCFSSAAGAVQPGEQLADPALEARARAISAELRCLVCQNQSIDDSDAPLARDLRLLVRQRLQAGDSDEDIREFLVARYGEYVLLKPRLSPGTALLWLTPALLLGAGIVLAFRRANRAGAASADALSEDEERSLARILASNGGGRNGRAAANLSEN